jgi:hypothetical protein
MPHFYLTKRLQLRFKKNAAAAAEPNRLIVFPSKDFLEILKWYPS